MQLLRASFMPKGSSVSSSLCGRSFSGFREKHPDIQLRYAIQKKLGEGSCGVVFRAEVRDDHSICALKIVQTSQVPIATIRYELEAHSAMSHPNIVALWGSFEVDNYLCISMELCLGGCFCEFVTDTLMERVAGCHELETKHVFRQMAAAVEHMQSKGFAHRDLKFENFVVEDSRLDMSDCTIKLIDFGFAKRFRIPAGVEGAGSSSLRLTTKCGSVGYTAPEVYLQQSYDERCDVFSLGVMLFCLLGGRMPFPGETNRQIVQQVKTSIPHVVPSEWAQVPAAAEILTFGMLVKEPDNRLTLRCVIDSLWMKQDQESCSDAAEYGTQVQLYRPAVGGA